MCGADESADNLVVPHSPFTIAPKSDPAIDAIAQQQVAADGVWGGIDGLPVHDAIR
jgi:hypothetical protein